MAVGVDKFAAETLKILNLHPLILHFLNRALEDGITPDLWKTLIIVPVPKKGDLSN